MRVLVKKQRQTEEFFVQLKAELKREWRHEEFIILRRKVKVL